MQADLILHGGNIATLDKQETAVDAVACWQGRIIAIGSSDEVMAWRGETTRVIDLGGKTVVPGLIDSHCHPDSHAITATLWEEVKPNRIGSVDAMLKLVEEKTATMADGDWFRAFGYDDRKCGGYPTLDQLDAVAHGKPVYIGRTDGHIAVVNTAMLRVFDIPDDAADPPHGRYDRDENGRMTGLLREAAARQMVLKMNEAYTVEQYATGLKHVFGLYLRNGVTSMHNSLTKPRGVEAYMNLLEVDELAMRVGIIVNGDDDRMTEDVLKAGIRTGFGDEWLRVVGIEWCPDCSTSGRTAAYYEPYVGEAVPGEPVPNTGMLLYDADDLREKVVRCHGAGLRVCVEGVGDRGIDFALDAIEAALKAHPKDDHRSRVEHCCYVTPPLIKRLKELDVTDSSATGFMYDLGDAYRNNRGEPAMEDMWPHRSLIDAGVPAPGHSDANICSTNPWPVFDSLVNRRSDSGGPLGKSQAITVTEALRTYTTLGAWTGFEEDLKGSIEIGKLADFAVLDRDPWTIDSLDLKNVQVTATIVGGEVVYEA